MKAKKSGGGRSFRIGKGGRREKGKRKEIKFEYVRKKKRKEKQG
jgi:hypothetical protein